MPNPQASTVVVAILGAMLAFSACPPPRLPTKACNTAIDCDLDEACRGGECVPNDGGGEGEGEGEGAVDEDAAINAVCQKVSACQGGGGQDVQSCVQSQRQQLDQLRASGDADCHQAADDFVALFQCAAAASCDQLADQTQLEQLCPIFIELNNQLGSCDLFSGEGEGEGEGEVCAFNVFDGGFGTTDAIFLDFVEGFLDADANPSCGTVFSATLSMDFAGDGSLILGGLATFDDFDLFSLVDLRVDLGGKASAVACGDDFTGLVAVQLDLIDGNVTNAVCGEVF